MVFRLQEWDGLMCLKCFFFLNNACYVVIFINIIMRPVRLERDITISPSEIIL